MWSFEAAADPSRNVVFASKRAGRVPVGRRERPETTPNVPLRLASVCRMSSSQRKAICGTHQPRAFIVTYQAGIYVTLLANYKQAFHGHCDDASAFNAAIFTSPRFDAFLHEEHGHRESSDRRLSWMR